MSFDKFEREIRQVSMQLTGKTIFKIEAYEAGDDQYCSILFRDGSSARIVGWADWINEVLGVSIDVDE